MSGCGPSGVVIEFETIEKSHGMSLRNISADNYVIKNNEDWTNLWEKFHVDFHIPPILVINFDEEMVIAVFQGPQPTGGYSIEITEIIATENEIQVRVTEITPGIFDVVTDAITSPYHIVKLERLNKEIVFKR